MSLFLFSQISSIIKCVPKVVLASDIDKTLTDESKHVPDDVISYLAELHKQDWEIVLVTGRTFSYAMMSLEKINFPYYLAVQNGAEVLKMPEKTILFRNFLPKSVAYFMDGIYRNIKEDFLIYSGLEQGDFCYYRTNKFSPHFLEYIEKLKPIASADWVEVEDLADIPQTSFPLIKGLGDLEGLKLVQKELNHIQLATSSIILDTVHPSLPILLVTHREVDKGLIFKKLKEHCGWNCPTIAAGDDMNDVPLLQSADLGIAMGTAPEELKKVAHIITTSSFEKGVIPALEEAKKRLLV